MRRFTRKNEQATPSTATKHYLAVNGQRKLHAAVCSTGCEICKAHDDEVRIAALRLMKI